MNKNLRKGEQLHLGLSLSGFGFPAWRRPTSNLDIFGFDHDARIVRAAEKAKLDFVFRADFAFLDVASAAGDPVAHFDPVTALAALAGITDRIGLIGTASAGLHEPYHVARAYGTLDLLSGGRAGLNIVTTTATRGRNFSGLNDLTYEDQYPRANEFTEVVEKLWASWPYDSIIGDRGSGRFFDPTKVQPINHTGRYFQVAGPLNIPNSQQMRPRIIQSGKSDQGRTFAAKYADAVFGDYFPSFENGREYSRNLKTRAASLGRDPRSLKVLPGVRLYVGKTEREARDLYEDIRAYGDVDDGLRKLKSLFGKDFSELDLDKPVPKGFFPEHIGLAFGTHSSLLEHYRDCLVNKPLKNVILDDIKLSAFWKIIGDPEQVADEIEAWFTIGEADGVIVLPGVLEDSLAHFFDDVVPLLRQRGRFREDYKGTTLASHLSE